MTVLIGIILEAPHENDIMACLSALFLTDPKDDREALKHSKGSRVDGTCTWIKGHKVYKSWFSSDSRLLWLSGGPGKGKTMISMYLAEDLEQSAEHSENTIILQYYCDNKDEKRNTATAILRGLIYQLLGARRHLYTHILPIYQIQKEGLFSTSSFQALWRIFEAMLCDPNLDKTYCVLDGMDECEKDSLIMILHKFKELFGTNLQSPQTFRLNLIIASRDEPKAIPQLLSGFPRIRLDSDTDTRVEQDIDCFIDAKVNELSTLGQYPSQLSEHIRKTFQERAQGTFLWVGIVANNLRNCSRTEVAKYLDLFPAGLDEVYARILLQIERHRRENAAKILRWVVMAIRPMTFTELSVVIDAFNDPSITHFSPAEIVKDQISWCGNILTIAGDEVNLIHQSAKDYLLREDVDSKPELEFFRVKEETANLEIASRCFYYLQEGALADGPVDLRKDVAHLAKFPLLRYATLYWPVHARSLARSEDIFKMSNSFYHKTSKIRDSWLQTWVKEGWWSPHPQPPSTLLHITSYLGILPLAENLLLEHCSNLEEKDGRGRTALQLAIKGGHEGVVRLLLDKGADFENTGYRFYDTALYISVELGHEAITRLLLQALARLEMSRDGDRETTLHRASESGNKHIVQLLLNNGANIEAKDEYQETALHKAATHEHDIMQHLLSNGTNFEAKDEYQETALHKAPMHGHDIVQLLLSNGANIEAKDHFQRTALHEAAHEGHDAVVQLLLENGADIEAKDRGKMTALHYAADNGYDVVVRQLLDHGASIEAQNIKTALHLAAAEGHHAVLQLLLENGADIEAKDREERTALHYAAKQGHQKVARLLLENGANASAKDSSGQTPLDLAKGGLLDEDTVRKNKDDHRETRQAIVRMPSSGVSSVQDRDANTETARNEKELSIECMPLWTGFGYTFLKVSAFLLLNLGFLYLYIFGFF